ncbi:conserved exported protein of unknown function [Georgfuchsia toluolica]|uniref:Uncharacterized protein n=2 Tax=Georgfuchsia toluolica TaxID=424218 RepID=A0A916J3M2_9PROT|nr:conserved exported protein of unknown function [Georgfuchsia toluolica]
MRAYFEKQGKKLGLTGAALLAFVNQCLAAVPAEVTTAMGDMKTDGIAVATAFLVATIAIIAFKFMKKGT